MKLWIYFVVFNLHALGICLATSREDNGSQSRHIAPRIYRRSLSGNGGGTYQLDPGSYGMGRNPGMRLTGSSRLVQEACVCASTSNSRASTRNNRASVLQSGASTSNSLNTSGTPLVLRAWASSSGAGHEAGWSSFPSFSAFPGSTTRSSSSTPSTPGSDTTGHLSPSSPLRMTYPLDGDSQTDQSSHTLRIRYDTSTQSLSAPPPPYFIVEPQIPASARRMFAQFRHDVSLHLGMATHREASNSDPNADPDQSKADEDILAALFLKRRILTDDEEEVFQEFESRFILLVADYTPRYSAAGFRAAFVCFVAATRPNWLTDEGLAQFLASIDAMPKGIATQIVALAEKLSDPSVHKMSSRNPSMLRDVTDAAGREFCRHASSLGPSGMALEMDVIRNLGLQPGSLQHTVFLQLFQAAWYVDPVTASSRSLPQWSSDIEARVHELREVRYDSEVLADLTARVRSITGEHNRPQEYTLGEAFTVMHILFDPLGLSFGSHGWNSVCEKLDEEVWHKVVNVFIWVRYICSTARTFV